MIPRRLVIVLLTLLGLCVGAVLGFSPLVRAVANKQAAARGWVLEIDKVRPALGGVWLIGVHVKPTDSSEFEARLNAVRLSVTLGGRPKALRAEGGQVELHGPFEQIRRRLRGSGQEAGSAESSQGGGLDLDLRGLDVNWLDSDLGEWHAGGAGFLRTAERGTGTVDHLVWSGEGKRFEAVGLSAVLRRDESRYLLERVSGLGFSVDLDVNGSVPDTDEASSADSLDDEPTAAADADTTDRKAAAAAKPSDADDVSEKPVPAALFGVLEPGFGAALRQRISAATQRAGPLLADAGLVELSGVRLRLHRGDDVLNLGPAGFRVGRTGQRLSASFTPGANAKNTQLQIAVDVPIGEGESRFDIAGGPITLANLGIQEGDMGLHRVADTQLQLKTQVTLYPSGESLDWLASGSVSYLSLNHPGLAPVPTEGIDLGWSGHGELGLDGTLIRIKSAELRVGKVRAELEVDLTRSVEGARIDGQLRVPLTACQSILESTPRALIPLLQGLVMKGTFSLDASLKFNAAELDDVQLGWDVANDCQIESPPPRIDPEYFRAPFEYRVFHAGGEEVMRVSGPRSKNWVELPQVSNHMETAVLVCEDSRFWHHQGFDPKALRSAILDNLKAGRFVRGASTISMQLAKNLYLGREKTLSRKLQEAALTMLLEQELRKDEILELYLNVIEYGPNVFGIKDAAQYYFGSHPRDLSLGQSLYLASILPNPYANYFDEDGRLRLKRAQYINRLMYIAKKIGRINDDELKQGLQERIIFGMPYEAAQEEGALKSDASDDEE